MAITTIDDKHLTNIATAIRQKRGIEDTFKPSEMAEAIKDISGGEPILQEVVVQPSINEQTITPSADYDGLSQVKIGAVTSSIDSDIKPENIKKGVEILGVIGNIEDRPAEPVLQNKTVEPSTGKQIITADIGYDGLRQVTVNEVTSKIDANIKADNIKQGITILGTEGSLDPGQVVVKKYQPKYISFWGNATVTNLVNETQSLDTSLLTTMKNMFSGNKKLVRVDISEWNTSNVINMESFFSNCNVLSETGVLKNFDVSKVTTMEYMFQDCKLFSRLDLENWNTSKVVKMGSMFFGCSNLSSINLSGWNTSNVTELGYMFYNCSHLREIDISSFTSESLKDTGSMFYGCSSLNKIDMRNLDLSNVGSASQMFRSVPASCLIIVKDDNNKARVNTITGGGYKNIKTLAEYQAEGGV